MIAQTDFSIDLWQIKGMRTCNIFLVLKWVCADFKLNQVPFSRTIEQDYRIKTNLICIFKLNQVPFSDIKLNQVPFSRTIEQDYRIKTNLICIFVLVELTCTKAFLFKVKAQIRKQQT